MKPLVVALTFAVLSLMGDHPCPFPSRVYSHPERYFGTWLKSAGVFRESFSSVLYTMNEEPLLLKHAKNGIVRIVYWPPFEVPKMVRFTLKRGSIATETKMLQFASRTSMPTVETKTVLSITNKPPANETLRILQELLQRGAIEQRPERHKEDSRVVLLEEDGTAVLVELVMPHEGYKAYYFQDCQDSELFQKIVTLVKPEFTSGQQGRTGQNLERE